MTINQKLAAVAAVLATLALIVGNDARQPSVTENTLAQQAERAENQVGALQLAVWIREQKGGLRILDVSAAGDIADFRIPSALHVSLDTITNVPRTSGTIVVYAADSARDRQAWLLLTSGGFDDVLLLRGGLEAWVDSVMNPAATADAQTRELSRYFGGRPRPPSDSVIPLAEKVRRIQRRGC